MTQDAKSKNIGAKLIFKWVLILVYLSCAIFFYNNTPFRTFGAGIFWLSIWTMRAVTPTRESSVMERRLGLAIAMLFIGFLLLYSIHQYHPFPPLALKAGKIVGAIVCVLAFTYEVYSDYLLFKSVRKGRGIKEYSAS